MKNLKALLGIIAMVAVIGFTMSACVVDTGGGGGGDPVTGVSLSSTSISMEVGDSRSLTATVRPSSARNKDVYWDSSRTSVATVDSNGRVTAVGAGTVVITVTTEDGGYSADCTVTVTGGSGGHTSHDWGPWQSNATQHWRVCSIGGEEDGRANHTGNPCTVCGYSSGGGGGGTYNTIADFRTWLSSASANSASNPYNVTLNISDIGGNYYAAGNLGNVLRSSAGTNKYVNITLGGNSLQTISVDAVKNCTTLVGITIPSSVDSIGITAFQGCSNLTSVNLGSGVKSIGNNAFENCTSLAIITIPSSVTSIGTYAFGRCTRLNSVTISSGISRISIGNYAFDRCTNLESISLPNGVTSIGNYAFTGCTNLPSVTIPGSINTFGNNAFQNCTNLTSVTITSGVQSIGPSAFLNCTNLTSVTIPNTVNSIDSGAFNGCSALPSITIPSSVAAIGSSAFYACNNLTTVTFQTGSNIASASFASYNVFPGDLRAKYLAATGGAGTYTRAGTVWTKQ
jgi:hypothetical protein